MKKIINIFFIFTFLMLFFSACTKDGDDETEIEIINENKNYTYIPGSLGIDAYYSDSIAERGTYITFYDSSDVDSRSWVFEGGNPYKSSAKTVNVRFYDSGHFSFSLTAFKDSIQDSLIRKDFIKVIDQGYYVGQVGHMYDTMVKMKMRQNIVTKTDKPELFATFFLKDTYEGGFNILEVNDGFRYLGPASDYAIVAEEDRDDEEPLFDFYRGSIEYNEVPFTYNESEMYYLGVDFELNKVALVPYHQWSVTGDALVEASDSDILLEKEFINENGFSFKMNSTPMVYGTYHIRYNGAWNVILDSTYSNEGFETDGLKLSLKIGFYHNQCDWGIWAIENFYTGNETGIFTWNYKNEFKWDANF